MAEKKANKKKTTKTTKVTNSKSKTTKNNKKQQKSSKQQNNKLIWFVGIGAIIIIAALVLILTNYNKSTTEETTSKTVAVVNGEIITEAELNAEKSRLQPELKDLLSDEEILTNLIDQELLYSQARKENIGVEEDIQNILDTNSITLEQLESNIALQGLSMEEFKDYLRVSKYLNQTLFKDLSVSQEELETFYNENLELFKTGESVLARHILVSTENRDLEEAQEIMQEVQDKLKNDKSNFCELASNYSEDPGSKDNCGEYPAFDMNANFVEPYKNTAFENKEGDVSIAKTDFGLHLIWTVEKYPPKTLELEEIKNELRKNILFEKQKELFAMYMEELKNKADIINCLKTPENKACLDESKDEQAKKEQTTNKEELITGEVIEENDDNAETENNLHSFAQCLTDKGAKMYGAYWCSHCNAQKESFGSSWERIEYIECANKDNPREQTPACQEAGISGYPTWVFEGKEYPGKQSFEKLSEITGCQL